MKNLTDPSEFECSKPHIVVEIIENEPNAVQGKTIVQRITGNITVTSFDAGEELAEQTSSHDMFIQIIGGAAVLVINEKKFKLRLGEGILIPANATHHFNTSEQFKMIATVIKHSYED